MATPFNNKKGKFKIRVEGKNVTLQFNPFKPQNTDFGYYIVTVTATDKNGQTVDIPVNAQLIQYNTHDLIMDASAVTHSIRMRLSSLVNETVKTGSGNDILTAIYSSATTSVMNGGAGDNTYRFNTTAGSGFAVHNFDTGDKVQVQTTWTSLSIYDNEADVVATGTDRYFFIKATGKLYRDGNGDAVYDSSKSNNINFKRGRNDRVVGTFYTDEGATLYTTFTAGQLEYKDF